MSVSAKMPTLTSPAVRHTTMWAFTEDGQACCDVLLANKCGFALPWCWQVPRAGGQSEHENTVQLAQDDVQYCHEAQQQCPERQQVASECSLSAGRLATLTSSCIPRAKLIMLMPPCAMCGLLKGTVSRHRKLHTSGSIMPFLGLAVGGAAAVDEAGHIAFVPGIDDEAGAELHHVEVGLPGLLGRLHAPLALHVTHHLPCTTSTIMSVAALPLRSGWQLQAVLHRSAVTVQAATSWQLCAARLFMMGAAF